MFDYIIVGGGSAACALAARLTENPSIRVLMLEAGLDKSDVRVEIPSLMAELYDSSKFNWQFWSQPEPNLNDQSIYCPRGKGVGGSSLINAMLYVRGHASDYDSWAAAGCEGWSYKELLPIFMRAEDNSRGASRYHGVGGPLTVSDPVATHSHSERMVLAGMQAGYAYNPDFNGESQEGVGLYQVTTRNLNRCSAAKAYIDPNRGRHNLRVISEARVLKVAIENGRAVGVHYERKGREHKVLCNKEVILCAGALQSPQLLMLSGIGDRSHLEEKGVECLHHLPGVGQNLQEHVDIVVVNESKINDTQSLSFKGLSKNIWGLVRHMFNKPGLASTTIVEAGGFIRLDPDESAPELQIHASPLLFDDHGFNKKLARRYGYSFHVTLMRPKSRGSITLASNDPNDSPLINLNLLSDDRDIDLLIEGIKIVRKIGQQDAYKLHHKDELIPGKDVTALKDLREFVHEKARHVYHPVGTCKMAVNDEMAVVDPELRVYGIEGLRVADASIMPTIITGNTNAPAMMIGEKAADLIKRHLAEGDASSQLGELESLQA